MHVELLCNDDVEVWSATPSVALLREIHEGDVTGAGSARWIACIGESKIALGDPVKGSSPWRQELSVPRWFLSQTPYDEGDTVNVRFIRSASLPPAEHLNIKVLGEVPEDWDLRASLEEPLSQLGVVEEGQILPCPMLEGVSLLVQVCQPAGPVFLHGNEISLEVEQVTQPTHVPTPTPAAYASTESFDDFASMIPMPEQTQSSFQAFRGTGHRLRK